MKYSKLFTSLAAAALCFGMTTAVYADETASADNTVTVKKNYKLVGEGTSPAETFTLVQTDKIQEDGEYAGTIPDLNEISGASYTAADGAATDGNQKLFTLALPTAAQYGNKPGIYTYTFKEAVPEQKNAGVVYAPADETVTIRVMVAYNEKGVLEVTGGVAKAESSEGNGEKKAIIENTYSANKLTISNAVTGNGGDKTKQFQYTVKLTGDASQTYQPIEFVVTRPHEEEGSVPASGTGKVTVNGDTFTFTLEDGDTAVLNNIPAGVTYTVTENNYSDYKTTVNGAASSEVTGEISGEQASGAAFVNEKGIKLDTGIFFDNMPLIVLGAALAFGVVLFVKKNRSSLED